MAYDFDAPIQEEPLPDPVPYVPPEPSPVPWGEYDFITPPQPEPLPDPVPVPPTPPGIPPWELPVQPEPPLPPGTDPGTPWLPTPGAEPPPGGWPPGWPGQPGQPPSVPPRPQGRRQRGLRSQGAYGAPGRDKSYAAQGWMRRWAPGGEVTAENVLASAYNNVLPYMDPGTQQAASQFIAALKPEAFGAYALRGPVGRQPMPGIGGGRPGFSPRPTERGERYVDPHRIDLALQQLTPAMIAKSLYGRNPTAEEVKNTEAQAAGLFWLREYLLTAREGMSYGGTRTGVETTPSGKLRPRVERKSALAHIQTLERQAQTSPALAPYLTLGQNIVNPRMPRAMQYGGVGGTRTYNPADAYLRGGYIPRQRWLT